MDEIKTTIKKWGNKKTAAIMSVVIALLLSIGLACSNVLFPSTGSAANYFIANLGLGSNAAIADDTPTSDTTDLGEVQKGDIIDYYLEATYTGFGDDKSGIVTFTDQLPEHMKLVTGTQTVSGTKKDCTPEIINTSGITWSDTNKYSYDEATRTFTAQVSQIPASDGASTGNVVRIHIYAQVLDDATTVTPTVENLYYINYFTIQHGAAKVNSNKVQFHSGNPSDKTYNIKYQFKGDVVPKGVTVPTDDGLYAVGSEVAVQPNMEAAGYKFSGWTVANTDKTGITFDSTTNKLTTSKDLPDTTTTITFEGEWTKLDPANVTYTWHGKDNSISDADDSADDLPSNLSTPAATTSDQGMPVHISEYPATDAERKATGYKADKDSYKNVYDGYEFLGWKVYITDSNNKKTEHVLTDIENKEREFTPTVDKGATAKTVEVHGYWKKRTFTIEFKVETGKTWPSGATLPDKITSKWGKQISVTDPKVSGYRFNGWRYVPDMGEGTTSDSGTSYSMPKANVIAYGSFSELHTVTVTGGGTAKAGDGKAATVIQAAEGESITLNQLTGMTDVEFKSWTTTATLKEWKENADKSATFVMGTEDVAIAANYQIMVGYFVVNGTWSDGSTGYKSVYVPVNRQTDETWQGTLPSNSVPTGMKPLETFEATPASWDKTPDTATNGVKADATGAATSTLLYTYSFTQPLNDITITYKTANINKGTVKLNNTTDTAGETKSETGSPLNGTFVGATASGKTGYKFSKWTQLGSDDPFAITASLVPYKVQNPGSEIEYYQKATYVANFVGYDYSVKFDINGGKSGTMENQKFQYDDGNEHNLTANTFVPQDGYHFAGWSKTAGGAVAFVDGANVATGSNKLVPTSDNQEITLYAVWQPNTYKVIYNSNRDGETQQETKEQTLTYDKSTEKLNANTFVYAGRTFKGWTKTKGSTTVDVQNQATKPNLVTENNGSINLYAVWELNNYTVKYDLNDGNPTTDPTASPDSYNDKTNVHWDDATLTPGTPTRPGYDFSRWVVSGKTDAVTNAKKYSELVTNDTVTSVTLQAVWTEKSAITIKYEVNDATLGQVSSATESVKPVTGTPSGSTATVKLPGYKFDHWQLKGQTTSLSTQAKYTPQKNTTTHVYEAATYVAVFVVDYADYKYQYYQQQAEDGTKYDLVSGDTKTLSKDKKTGENPTIPATQVGGKDAKSYTGFKTTPTKVTYSKTGVTETQTVQTVANDGSLVIKIYYDRNTFDVTFDNQGHGTQPAKKTGVRYGQKVTSPGNLTQTGWTFGGWYKQAACTQTWNFLTDTMPNNALTIYAKWTANKYTVKFNGNKGTGTSTVSGSVADQPFVYDTPQKLNENKFSRVGYTFKNWNTQADGKGTAYTNTQQVSNLASADGATVTLYAIWEANKYNVVFEKNKGTGSTDVSGTMVNQEVTFDIETNLNKNQYSRKGYVFAGYDLTSTKNPSVSGVDFPDNSTILVRADNFASYVKNNQITLYAIWRANSYTIRYNADDKRPTGMMTPQNATYDQNVTLKNNEYKLPGWTFKKWNTSRYALGTEYSAGQVVKNLTDESNGFFDLYASWTENDWYVVKYDLNDGNPTTDPTASPDSYADKTNLTWASDTLTPGTPTRPGYNFVKWVVSGTSTEVTNTTKYSEIAADDTVNSVTLQAVWAEKDAVTIKYEVNDATLGQVSSATESVKPVTGTPSGSTATVKLPGYKFDHWQVKGQTTSLSTQAKYTPQKNTTTHVYEAVTYVAVFVTDYADYKYQYYQQQAEDGTKYDLVSGDTKTLSKDKKTGENPTVPATQVGGKDAKSYTGFKTTPTKVTYTKTGVTETETMQTVANDGSLVIKIYYDRNTFDVTFDIQGHGTQQAKVTGVRYGQKILSPGNLTQTGWTFGGWYKQAACTQTWNFSTDTMPNNALTIYAKWTANKHTIKFDGNKGSGTSSVSGTVADQPFVYDTPQKLNENKFSRIGYTFKNWNTQADGKGTAYNNLQQVQNLASADGATVTLYAIWEANKYNVVFEKNKGTGSTDVSGTMANQEITFDVETKLNSNQYTRTGYKFAGYDFTSTKDPSASGVDFTDGSTILVRASNFDSYVKNNKVTIYAIWRANSYTIRYNAGEKNPTGTMTPQNAKYDQNITLKTNEFKLPGWTFNKWNTALNGSGTAYSAGQVVSNLKDEDNSFVDLYSTWTENNWYVVKYDAGKGATSTYADKTNVTWAASGLLPQNNPVRKGYTFTNWTVSNDTASTARAVTNANAYSVLVGYMGGDDQTKNITLKANYTLDKKDNTGAETDGTIVRANNIRMSVEEAKALLAKDSAGKLSDLVGRSGAFAEKTSDGTPVAITSVNADNIKAQAGAYTFTLSCANGANVTATATVYDRTLSNGQASIAANNFVVSKDEVTKYTLTSGTTAKAKLIELAQAYAWDNKTLQEIGIANVSSTIAAEVGSGYTVTFTSNAAGDGKNVSITVSVIVVDKADEAAGVRITGHNFIVTSAEVGDSGLSAEKIIELSGAFAYKTDTKTAVDVRVPNPGAVKKEVGTYGVTISTTVQSGPSILVQAKVVNNKTEKNGEAIGANDFVIGKNEIESLDLAKAIKLANASAYETASGKEVAITSFDKSKVKAEYGKFPLSFSTAKGTTVTVNVTVRDSDSGTGDDKYGHIVANNFTIGLKELQAIASKGKESVDKEIIKRSNAEAYYFKDTLNGMPKKETEVNISAISPEGMYTGGAVGVYQITLMTFFSYVSDSGSTGKIENTQIQCTVTDSNSHFDETNQEVIFANDFAISKSEAKSLTLEKAIRLSQAYAYEQETFTSVAVTTFDNSKAIDRKGFYKASFSTAKGTTVEVTVTVTDSGKEDTTKKEYISANDIILSIDEAKSALNNKTMLISKADAKAISTETGASVSVSVDDSKTTLEAKRGEYVVGFKTDAGTSITVKATVKDKREESTANKEVISANNFVISVTEAQKALSNKNTLITMANASAYSTETYDEVNVSVDDATTTLAAKVGTYNVGFKTAKGTAIVVQAIVKDSVTVDSNTGETIGANNFSIAKNKVASLDLATAIRLAQAWAYETATGKEVTITKFDKAKVKAEQGVYDLTFSTAKNTSVTIKVTVTANGTEDETNKEYISANDFVIALDKVTGALADGSQLVTLASAKAYSTVDGATVSVSVNNDSTITTLKAAIGEYTVGFKTAKGTAITVKATVKDNVNIDSTTGETIGANNFTIAKSEVNALNLAIAKKLANAFAYETATGKEVEVTGFDKSKVKAEKGRYDAVFSTAKGTKVTVKVTVTDNGKEDSATKQYISANDFVLNVTEAQSALSGSNTLLIKRADAKAYSLVDGASIEVTVDTSKTTLKAAKGTYDVGFKTAAGTAITVKATVKDVVGENTDTKEIISANNFVVKTSDVATLNNDKVKQLANVVASKTDTGEAITNISVAHSIKAEVGEYDVKFSLASGLSITVKAKVVDVVVDSSDANERIWANHFTISSSEAKKPIADNDLIQRANAGAESNADQSKLNVTVESRSTINEGKLGTYEITFKTTGTSESGIKAQGTTVTVNCTIVDNLAIKDNVAISANNFRMSLDDVNKFNSATAANKLKTVIDNSNARAWYTDSGANLGIATYSGTISAIKGEYVITVTSNTPAGQGKTEADRVSVDLTVTVVDQKGETDGENGVVIWANDFTTTKDVVAAGMKDEDIISWAHAGARLKKDASSVKVIVAENNAKAEIGTYTIKFATEGDASTRAEVTINCHVTENTIAEGDVAITAKRFYVSADEAKELTQAKLDDSGTADKTKAELIRLANAKATRQSDGSDVGIATVKSGIAEIDGVVARGTYQVTFVANEVNKAQPQITVLAIVTDKSTEDKDKGERIVASDFEMSVKDVQTATDETYINLANARAYKIDDHVAVDITRVDKSAVKAARGTYAVSFFTAKGTSATVNCVVTDSQETENGIQISANDFYLTKDEVESFTFDQAKTRSQVKAYLSDTLDALEIANIDWGDLKTNPVLGNHVVTFTTAPHNNLTASVQVRAIVTDAFDEGDVVGISANNFSASVQMVKDYKLDNPNDGKNMLIKLAQAKGWKVSDKSELEVNVSNCEIKPIRGIYDVTFSVLYGTETKTVTVKASISDSGAIDRPDPENPDPDDPSKITEIISANDFTVTVDEATVILAKETDALNADLISLAGAKATLLSDGSDLNINVDKGSFAAVKKDYEIKFTVDSAKASSVNIVAHVVDNKGTDNPENPDQATLGISANNFELSIEQASQLPDPGSAGAEITDTTQKALMRTLSQVRAWKIADKSEIGIEKAISFVKAQKGTYKMTFVSVTVDGHAASVDCEVRVKDSSTQDDTNKESISANNFSITADDVATFTSQEAILRSQAKAISTIDGSEIPVTRADISKIKAEKGTYPVVLSTEKGTSVTVVCTVTEKSSPKPGEDDLNKERIWANPFSISVEDAQNILSAQTDQDIALAKDKLKKLANVFAQQTVSPYDEVAVTVVDYGALKAKKGNYDITFATDKGTSVTVRATVVDEVITEGDVAIAATPFTVSKAEVTAMNLDDSEKGRVSLIKLAKANAYNKNDFSRINIDEVTTDIQAKAGAYNVTFTATLDDKTASITIVATVTDKGSVDPTPTPDPDQPDPKPDPKPDPDPDPDPFPDPDPTDPDFVNVVVYGNDFTVSIDEVNQYNLTDGSASLEKLIDLAKAQAYTRTDRNDVEIVKATSTIKAVIGTYTVEFETEEVDGKSATLEVEARVTGKSVVDEKNGEKITANDFSLSKDEADAIANGQVSENDSIVRKAYAVNTLNDGQKELVRLANAHAYRLSDGFEIDFADVKFNYNGQVGTSTVEFATAKGTTLQVNAEVKSISAEENAINKERISANDIELTYEEAVSLLAKPKAEIEQYLIEAMNAEAVSTLDGSVVEIANVSHNIQTNEGVYDVTFSTEKGTSVTAKAGVGVNPTRASKLSSTGDMIGSILPLLVLVIAGSTYVVCRRKKKIAKAK